MCPASVCSLRAFRKTEQLHIEGQRCRIGAYDHADRRNESAYTAIEGRYRNNGTPRPPESVMR